MRSSVLLVLLSFTLAACGSNENGSPAAGTSEGTPEPATISYPDSVAGLKQLCEDMFTAVKANNTARAKAIGATLKLENPEAWFAETFGEAAGPRLAEAHREMGNPDQIIVLFMNSAEKGRTEAIVERFDNGDDQEATAFQSEALKAMKKPVALYSIRFVEPGKSSGFHLNSLAYIDGSFRILGEMKTLNTKPMSPELAAVSSLRLKDAETYFRTGKLPD